LHQLGIFPPIDVLPSLSRLMNRGIGARHTRADHRELAGRLYRAYAQGRELRRLEAVVGREGLLAGDCRLLDFATRFEREFVHQGAARRTVGETLDLGATLLAEFAGEAPC
jgi:V/A-type H+-transporting ATPase subunit B